MEQDLQTKIQEAVATLLGALDGLEQDTAALQADMAAINGRMDLTQARLTALEAKLVKDGGCPVQDDNGDGNADGEEDAAPEPPTTEPPTTDPLPKVVWAERNVTSENDLHEAIANRKPGHDNILAPGIYKGFFKLESERVSDERNGTAEYPIRFRARDGRGSSVIRSTSGNRPPIEGKAVKHIIFQDLAFEGIGSGRDASAGLLLTHDRAYAPDDWVANVLILNCDITGTGRDGIKFATARQCALLGCRIESPSVAQSGIDMVTCHSMLVAYNLVRAGNQDALTIKMGSQDGRVYGNILHSHGYTGSIAGGHGSSYSSRPYPGGLLGFMHRRGLWRGNYCRGTGHGLYLSGAQDCTIRDNWVPGGIKEQPGKAANGATWPSFGNGIENAMEREPTAAELALLGPRALTADLAGVLTTGAHLPDLKLDW